MIESAPPVRISRVTVEGLFGTFNYDLGAKSAFDNVVIFYGDNGSGKTTLLKLIFHLLSPADDQNHRTTLKGMPFDRLSIELSNGTTFTATRDPDQSDRVSYLVSRDGKADILWVHAPKGDNSEVMAAITRTLEPAPVNWLVSSSRALSTNTSTTADITKNYERIFSEYQSFLKINSQAQKGFITALEELHLAVYLMSADRQLLSDHRDKLLDRMVERETAASMKQDSKLDSIAQTRSIYVLHAIENAARWISRQAVQGSNAGSSNVNHIYADIVKRLVEISDEKRSTSTSAKIKKGLIERLQVLGERNKGYAEMEFTSQLPIDDIIKSINSIKSQAAAQTVQQVLEPYFDALEARLTALEEIYNLTAKFVSNLNRFLAFKRVAFSLTKGFQIINESGGIIKPEQLSSGEQQLLLLLCRTIVARDKRCIFIIDEPEISLNIKWQRLLIKALLDITGSETQFILATHSLELLSQHSNRVAQLIDSRAPTVKRQARIINDTEANDS